jgi:uncharacterized membrane protein
MLYDLLKTLHILCAVAAVGSNLTYSAWFLRGAREPEHFGFALRGVRFIDDWLSNPAYAGLGVSGACLVVAGGLPWGLAWVWGGMSLLVLTSILGLGVYGPLLRRQIRALDDEGPDSPRFRSLSLQGACLGGLFGVLNLLTFGLMVFKPEKF